MKKFFYRVGRGETVTSLADKFGIPQTVIVNSNLLTQEVQEGDVLFIEETDGKIYTAEPFDTLESVAEKFGVPPERIERANGVDYIFYGLKIIIPE